MQLEKGQLFLRTDTPIEYMYLLTEGVVYSYRFSRKGEKIAHSFYGPGDILPVAGVRPIDLASSSFETLTNIKAYRLPRSQFTKLIKSNGQASYELAVRITEQYTHYVQRVGNLQYTNAFDRVAYCFLLLAERFGQPLPDGAIKITVPLTHNLIASTVNIARETASRCMKRLATKGIVRKQAKFYVVSNPADLAAELRDKSIFIPILFR